MRILLLTSLALVSCGAEDQELPSLPTVAAVAPTDESAAGQSGKGDKGDKGEKGEKGEKGDQGIQGEDGIDGLDGEDGLAGADGLGGAQGIQGIAGIDGLDGANGVNGTNGAAGTNGTNGAQGIAGTDGVDGTDGVNGASWKIYKADGTALGYFMQYADIPYHGSADFTQQTAHVVIMRSLTSNDYTAYKIGETASGTTATPDNRTSYWPNPLKFRMLGADSNNYPIYYTGASCTGTSNVRYSSGGNDPLNASQISAGSLMLMAAYKNMWVLEENGTYETKLTPGQPAGNTGTSASYRVGGNCSANAVGSSNYRVVTIRVATFPSSLGLDWYVDL